MWNNRCRWVRARLPLLAGDDLIGFERRRAERHLLLCPNCRAMLASYREALEALHTAVDSPVAASPGAPSIWPVLEQQIRESRRPASSATWGWAAIGPRALAWSGAALAASVLLAAWIAVRPTPQFPRVPDRHPAPIVTLSVPPKKPAAPLPAAPREPAPSKEALAATEVPSSPRPPSEPERAAADSSSREQPSH